jgi:transposase InsO family protein
MNWKRMLAYVTGSVDEELLARNEYLVTENRILRNQVPGRIRLTDPERISLASAAKRQFGEILESVGVEPLRLPVRSPNLNAFAERFVRSIKESCVERMIFFGEPALRRVVSEFALHYHTERNHQGLENKIIQPEFAEFPDIGAIRSRQGLGGLLRYYYREAA